MSSQVQAAITCANAQDIIPPAGHYSHVCVANGLVFVSGQLPITPEGKALRDASFDVQTKQVLRNIDAALNAAGVTRKSLVQVRVFVSNMEHWPTFNTLYADWIGSHKPARAVAESASLHYGSAVEVEAIALASAT